MRVKSLVRRRPSVPMVVSFIALFVSLGGVGYLTFCSSRTIGHLPPRQQRLVWLQGLGLTYEEMAGYTGASTRTVERQLLRAKRTLRSEDG